MMSLTQGEKLVNVSKTEPSRSVILEQTARRTKIIRKLVAFGATLAVSTAAGAGAELVDNHFIGHALGLAIGSDHNLPRTVTNNVLKTNNALAVPESVKYAKNLLQTEFSKTEGNHTTVNAPVLQGTVITLAKNVAEQTPSGSNFGFGMVRVSIPHAFALSPGCEGDGSMNTSKCWYGYVEQSGDNENGDNDKDTMIIAINEFDPTTDVYVQNGTPSPGTATSVEIVAMGSKTDHNGDSNNAYAFDLYNPIIVGTKQPIAEILD